MVAVLDFSLYSIALYTSLTRAQGFSLIVTTYKSTALKVNGITKDILLDIPNPNQGMIFITQKGYRKLCVITSTYLPTQEILEYPQEYVSHLTHKKSIESILQITQNTITWVLCSSV